MRKNMKIVGGIALSAVVLMTAASSAIGASSFEEKMDKCLTKNANTKDAATVMLSCTAADGKLTDCSVLSDSMPGKGFDKAALCVADAIPIGGKTGPIKVPLRFPGGG